MAGLADMINLDDGIDLSRYTPGFNPQASELNQNQGGLLSMLDPSKMSLQNLGMIGGLGSSLMGILGQRRNNKLQRNALNFQKSATNRNIKNQAATVNNQLGNQETLAAQMFGNRVGTSGYKDYLKKNHTRVDGSALQ